MKRYFILLFLLLLLPFKANAGCSDEELVILQKLANNINVSYEYDKTTNNFVVSFTNMRPELIITDIDNNKDYYYSGELRIKNVASGHHSYIIYAYDKNCYDDELGAKSVNLPYYNKYYLESDCNNISDYRYCSKWLPNAISYEEWHKNVTKYKDSIKKEEIEKKQNEKKETFLDILRGFMIDFYVEYYYVILPISILALSAIIYLKNKNDQLI